MRTKKYMKIIAFFKEENIEWEKLMYSNNGPAYLASAGFKLQWRRNVISKSFVPKTELLPTWTPPSMIDHGVFVNCAPYVFDMQ